MPKLGIINSIVRNYPRRRALSSASVYQIARFKGGGMTGNRKFPGTRPGTFSQPSINGARRWNCGATGFEFVKPSSGSPTFRYYSGLSRYSWTDDFLYGAPTYADASHPNYAFWQSVSSSLYSFLNTYHSGGLPTNKVIKVWVSWDKYVSVQPLGFTFIEENEPDEQWVYDEKREFSYLTTSPAGVCCRYAIFS